jgi:PHP family Zn ribbon phosphoesterase
LKPLNKQGTRVIIINPLEDLIKSINNGDFKKYIEETWWPLIHKYGANIYIKNKEEVHKAEIPKIFPIEPSKNNPIIKGKY